MDKKVVWNKASSYMKAVCANLPGHRLLIFFIASIAYLELIYRVWIIRALNWDYLFPVLFSFSAGTVLSLISSLFSGKINRAAAAILTALLVLCYNIQLIYFCIFRTPFTIYSLTGAGDAVQFSGVVYETILRNLVAVLLLFLPLVFLLLNKSRFPFQRIKIRSLYSLLIFCILSYGISILCVNLTGDSNVSQYTLYYKTYSPELSVNRLGLLTTMRLDFQRLVFGMRTAETAGGINTEKSEPAAQSTVETEGSGHVSQIAGATDETMPQEVENPAIKAENPFNTMPIDFDSLIAAEKDPTILDMHRYFSSAEPTKKNKYTGLFKDCNLILLTCESFSPYAVDPVRTPTLYKMSTGGFKFNNFYNPVWGGKHLRRRIRGMHRSDA